MALSADARSKIRNHGNIKNGSYTVGTGAVIYNGALVALNTTTGRAVAATAATGRKFLGVAEDDTRTGNTSGTVAVNVIWNCEALIDAAAALTTAYIGSNCAVSADNQVTTLSDAGTTAVRVRVGEVIQIESGDAWVHLRNFSESDV